MATTKRNPKAKVTPVVAGSITDITHVDIPAATDGKTEPVISEHEVIPDKAELSLEVRISNEVARFNKADVGIAALNKKYGRLKIKDMTDKDGYAAVREAWGIVRTTRTDLEKKGLEIRSDYNTITKAVKGEQDRLIELVTPLEEKLHKMWKGIDDQKAQAKADAEAAEKEQLMTRLQLLSDAGMKLVDGFYAIGDTIAMDVATIRTQTEDQFTKLLDTVKAKKLELDQLEEQQREEQRQQREQFEADQKKLRDAQDDLQRQKDDLKRQQDQLQQQQNDLRKAKRSGRIDALKGFGLTYRGTDDTWRHEDGFNIPYFFVSEAALEMTDEEWDKAVPLWKKNVEDLKSKYAQHLVDIEEERKVLEGRKKFIGEEMQAAGMTYNYTNDTFLYFNQVTPVFSIKMTEALAMDEATLAQKCVDLAVQVRDAIQNQKLHDNKQAGIREQERKAKLGDAQLFRELLENYAMPPATIRDDFKTDQYRVRFEEFTNRMQNLVNEFMPEKEAVVV